MEDSSLNQAHFETRKAERLTRQGNLDLAIECHEKAATLISQSMLLSDLSTVQQSLLCQREFHIRQVWLLQSKIALLEKYQKRKMNSTSGKEMGSQMDTQRLKITQMEIMRTLTEADTALQDHADVCTSMDPNLSHVIECLQKMRQQLEQLFQFSHVSETDLQIEAAIQPVDIFGQSESITQSISPDEDKRPSEAELPTFAPLEKPNFDFEFKFDD